MSKCNAKHPSKTYHMAPVRSEVIEEVARRHDTEEAEKLGSLAVRLATLRTFGIDGERPH